VGSLRSLAFPSREVSSLLFPESQLNHRCRPEALTAGTKGLACAKEVAMPVVAVPRALRERLGEEGSEDLARLLSSLE
jgi:hypothetical protein